MFVVAQRMGNSCSSETEKLILPREAGLSIKSLPFWTSHCREPGLTDITVITNIWGNMIVLNVLTILINKQISKYYLFVSWVYKVLTYLRNTKLLLIKNWQLQKVGKPKLICCPLFVIPPQYVPQTEALRRQPGHYVFVYGSQISRQFLPKSAQHVLFQLWADQRPPTHHCHFADRSTDLTDTGAASSLCVSHHQRHRNILLSGSLMLSNRTSRGADNGKVFEVIIHDFMEKVSIMSS